MNNLLCPIIKQVSWSKNVPPTIFTSSILCEFFAKQKTRVRHGCHRSETNVRVHLKRPSFGKAKTRVKELTRRSIL